jgi:integrase
MLLTINTVGWGAGLLPSSREGAMVVPVSSKKGRYQLLVVQPPQEAPVTASRLGPPSDRKYFARPRGRFVLDPSISAPGEVELDLALVRVQLAWSVDANEGRVSLDSAKRYAKDCEGFVRYAASRGVDRLGSVTPTLVAEWLHAPGADGLPIGVNRRRARLGALRRFFDALFLAGYWDVNPARSLNEPRTQERFVSPLSEGQIGQLKRTAARRVDSSKVPAALALILLGATPREAGYVRRGDVDLVNRRVFLHGGSGWYHDRWVPIDDEWAFEALRTRAAVIDSKLPLWGDSAPVLMVYGPRSEVATPEHRAASIAGSITDLMKAARVYRKGVTRVESIREYLAVRHFEGTGSIEGTAERLGMSSLDTVAHIIGVDWAARFRIDAPKPEVSTERW